MQQIGPTVVVRLAWPSCLILIGLYNVIFSDRFAWPIGSSGLIEILSNWRFFSITFWPSAVLTLGSSEPLLKRVTHNTVCLYLFYSGHGRVNGKHPHGPRFRRRSHAHSHGLTLPHVLM